MKKLLTLGILVIALSCKTESEVEPATGTFLRYFGSEKNHVAILAMEADNGFTLLCNVEVQNATNTGYKIKMIHTDKNGNFLWEQSYPAYIPDEGSNEVTQDNTMKAASFIPLASSGYLVIGDRINEDGPSDLLLLHLDLNGNRIGTKTISGKDLDPDETRYGDKSLHGNAIIASEDENGLNYLILGSIDNDPGIANADDMFVARIAPDLSLSWTQEFGDFESTVVNRLYVTPDQNLFWSASVKNSEQEDVRIVKVAPNSQGNSLGTPVVTPNWDEKAFDICPTIGGWAVTGSTNERGTDDVYLMKITANSDVVFHKTYEQLDLGLNDQGNSICQATDGGLVILATVESPITQKDMYLMKVDGISGNIIWKNNLGGADHEEGASVRPLNDGSYLVYGTAYFGSRVKKLLLMKVNKNGTL